jgi:RNA polymerase sigma-70 factor (ECF subfamily)
MVEIKKNGTPPAGPPQQDEDRFSGLIAEHQRRVYSLALRLTGNAAAADDITQETFIAAWKHLEGFRGDSSLKTWLLRIAANKVRSYWRWKKLRSWVGLDQREEDGEGLALNEVLPDDPAGRPEQAALAADLERRVQAAISLLPPRQREVAVLRAQELSMAEIGEALGMAEGTVKAHWFEARKKLGASLGEYL